LRGEKGRFFGKMENRFLLEGPLALYRSMAFRHGRFIYARRLKSLSDAGAPRGAFSQLACGPPGRYDENPPHSFVRRVFRGVLSRKPTVLRSTKSAQAP